MTGVSRALAVGASIVAVAGMPAARAGATPSSTFTEYATAIRAPGPTESVGECTATEFAGTNHALGAPDGVSWTIDVAARTCDSDDHDAMVDFAPILCDSYSGITGVHGTITMTAQTTQSGIITWGVIQPANNLVSPGGQPAPDTGGTITFDFGTAPIATSQLLTLLETKSMVSILTKGVAGRVYNIDSFALSITGDLSHCHIDQDGDGLDNVQEAHYGTDPLKADTDGGGVNDGVEVARGSNPLDPSDDLHWPPASTSTTTTTVAQLPRTGSSSAPFGIAAVLLVVAGASAAAIASRRDRAARSRR